MSTTQTRSRNRSGAGQAARSAKPRRTVPTGYAVSLLALWFGTTIAALLTVVGLLVLGNSYTGGRMPAQTGGHDHSSHSHAGHQHAPPDGGDQANATGSELAVRARHLGNLTVRITASVAMNGTDSLTDAAVVAHTDMVQMPGAHTQGPLRLQPVPASPGRYAINTPVPMPGDYRIHVRLNGPAPAEQTITVPVGTTGNP